MHARKINQIFARWQTLNPEPTTELVWRTPFQLLIAVILSAQSTDKMVNIVTKELFRLAPSARRMAALGHERIGEAIARLGLYRNKARFIEQCSQMLVQEFAGRIPDNRDQLMQLAGVGRKTANVILNTLYGQNEIAVDTHIFRVANRIGLAQAKTPLAVENALKAAVPAQYARYAHHWMILHGRYVCKARVPQCHSCPVSQWCEYDQKPMMHPDKPRRRVERATKKPLRHTA
ncbi:MAG: endonuclease III [Gammaproteobacteria bacterium]|nr:endonuclease III [Gammaproteobacteria bacterium]